MRTLMLIILISTISISIARSQGIQNNFFTRSESKTYGHLSTELDPSLSVALGVGHVFSIQEKKVLTSLAINSPLALFGKSAGIAIAGSTFLLDNEWDIRTTVDLRTKFFSNNLSHGSTYNFNVTVNPGYYQDKWFSSLSISYRKYLMTYRKHTTEYREVFPEVRDGWYTNDSGLIFIGVAGGYFFNNVELNASLSAKLPDNFEDYAPFLLPVFFSLGANFSF